MEGDGKTFHPSPGKKPFRQIHLLKYLHCRCLLSLGAYLLENFSNNHRRTPLENNWPLRRGRRDLCQRHHVRGKGARDSWCNAVSLLPFGRTLVCLPGITQLPVLVCQQRSLLILVPLSIAFSFGYFFEGQYSWKPIFLKSIFSELRNAK